MAASDTAKLIAALTLKDGFTGPLKKMDGALNKFDAHLKSTDTRALRAGKQIGTGIKAGAAIAAAGIGVLFSQIGFGLNQLSELEGLTAQTNAVIKSTGGLAGVSAAQVRSLAEEYENLNAAVDDKAIQNAENVLLTFTSVTKTTFKPALEAALNLSSALGTDLQGAVIQVGKALNDPIKGITALRRVGVQFSDEQKKQIEGFFSLTEEEAKRFETLNKADAKRFLATKRQNALQQAQRVILRELGTEFGGSFAAKGKTVSGTIAGIGDAVEDLQKAVATGLFPVIQKLLPRFRDALQNPALLRGVEDLGNAIAGLFSDANIAEGSKLLSAAFDTAKSVAPAIRDAAVITGNVIKTAVDLFRSLPPEIQALAVAGLAINKLTGGLVTNIAGGLISAVISSFKGLMNVNAAVVNVNGPVGGLPGSGGGPSLPNAIPAVGAGAAGIGLGTVAALIIAPASIAALALAITKASDPTGARNDQGRINTARARGIPESNIRGGPAKPTPVIIEQDRDESRQAARDRALDHHITEIPKAVTKAQAKAIASAAESANRIRLAALATKQAIRDKDLSVHVTVPVQSRTLVNGRLLDAATSRFTTTIVGSKGATAEFG